MRSFPILLLATACIVSCAEQEPLPVFGERVWDGEHLEIWATDDARICGGSYEALDHHAQQVSEYVNPLGLSSNTERYRYYWLSPEEHEEYDPCPSVGGGCFRGATAVYASRYSSHEVVHAEFALGHHSFVDEGLAVMLGDFGLGEIVETTSIPDIIDETQGRSLHNEHYGSAGKFIRAMEELHPEEFLPPLLETERTDDFERFATTVTQGDVDLDAAITLNESESECRLEAFRLAVSECSLVPLAWANEAEWSASGVLDCASEHTVGPDASGAIWTIRSFDIVERGSYTVTAVTEGFAVLAGCDAPWCGSAFTGAFKPPGWLLLVSTVPSTVEMEPGRYWIRVEQEIEQDPAPFSLSVVRERDE
ncbi:MAG: hypothetical protein ACRBN8_08755 [Nannocystales bacterium]